MKLLPIRLFALLMFFDIYSQSVQSFGFFRSCYIPTCADSRRTCSQPVTCKNDHLIHGRCNQILKKKAAYSRRKNARLIFWKCDNNHQVDPTFCGRCQDQAAQLPIPICPACLGATQPINLKMVCPELLRCRNRHVLQEQCNKPLPKGWRCPNEDCKKTSLSYLLQAHKCPYSHVIAPENCPNVEDCDDQVDQHCVTPSPTDGTPPLLEN
ncbi:hypothetical protein O181_019482 [Austropuccinia psidii MF-1]|uniref:Uncharacterized protein n=1 Tax=Austropuccinia psidii MF-1 TaxID=1389203 RepID=A0A9Q3C9T8_9BASI|nr:hypothetical protein [Austropuccinia psidii MF-1]